MQGLIFHCRIEMGLGNYTTGRAASLHSLEFLTIGDATADFTDAEILVNEEELVTLDEGPLHRGPAATVGFVARRRR